MDMTSSVLSKNYRSQKEKRKTRVTAKRDLARPYRLGTKMIWPYTMGLE